MQLKSASSAEDCVEELKDGCGTAMYVAPEIAGGASRCSYGFPVDWWGLGCVLMEMVTGSAPFGDSDQMNKFEIFNKINNDSVSFPMFISTSLKALVSSLLDKDPKRRGAWSDVQSSAWTTGVSKQA